MKTMLKRSISGTRLEPLLRRVHGYVGSQPIVAHLQARLGDKSRLYDLQTLQVMRKLLQPGSCCIDVGCHRGVIMKEMVALAPQGDHWGFEPLPDLFAGLVERFKDNPRVHLRAEALSDAEGSATFQHVVDQPGYSGFRKRRYESADTRTVEIQVRMARLDELIPNEQRIDLIKIDVEGAELQVLRGAEGLVRRCKPVIVFEHGLGAADHYGTEPEHIHDLLSGYGLSIGLMGDWLAGRRDKAFSRAAFGDEFRQARNFYFIAWS